MNPETSPVADPLFGNNPSDLMRAAIDPASHVPTDDPRAWQPPTPEDLQARLGGRYLIEAFLARGGMGAVYRGMQTSLKRPVAIKILPQQLRDLDPSFAQRFKLEARAMAHLNHPGIVSVYDFGEMADGTLYIVMEFIDGTDVAHMVRDQGRLSSAHAMAITAHVCDALQYAHENGVIHRDIKPANIMVGYNGSVKVADFGLAKSANQQNSSLTLSGHVMGTLNFVAPEALTLGMGIDHRADIYAVGVMLYQMLTGKLPQGLFEMPSMQVPGLDPRYDAIVASAMREDREQRYQRILDMRHALDDILTQPVPRPEASQQTLPSATASLLQTQRHPIGKLKEGQTPPTARPGQRPAKARSLSAQAAKAPVKLKSQRVAIAAVFVLATAGGGYFWTSPPPSRPVEVKLNLVNIDPHSVDDNARFGIELLESSEFLITSNKPVSLKKIPAGVIAPFYAELKIGPPESQSTHCLLIDGVGTPNPKGYLDSNANDDLTDDPVCRFEFAPDYRKDGSQDMRIDALLELKSMETEFQARIGCLVPCKKGGAPENLYLNGWYARTGSVRIQDKEIGALMLDDRCTGDFRDQRCNFGLDLNGDGKFRYQDGEVIFVGDHFNVNGTIYELSGLTPSGDSFQLTQNTTLIGAFAPSFEADTLSDGKIAMPNSYRGKILLVHFWGFEGTRAHQDLSIIKLVYEKHHTAGLEVLGECWSLEQLEKRIAFLKERQMPWPQVSNWDNSVLKLFRINSVTNVLIDGDSGKILAIGFHGSEIEPTVAKALAEKKR